MASVPTDKAQERALAFLVGKSGYTVRTLILKLFKNNFVPLESSVVGDLTEADFTGYAAAAMASGDWTLSGTAPNLATGATKTFTSSAGSQNQDIYGYYIITATDGELIVAERFSSLLNIANNGDAISVTPRLTMANG